jgi:hypothetical protein
MEKISNIVRGSPRVASVDTKSAGAVRPGALTFGRPVGESPQGNDRVETTAAKATAMQAEMNEARKVRAEDRTVANMSDQFFMSRVRRPEEEAPVKGKVAAREVDGETREELDGEERQSVEAAQPQGYVPRGSYVNVHA